MTAGAGDLHESLLGVDYGRKRIGIAGVDRLWIAVQPLLALEGTPEHAVGEIARICADRAVERVVVGLPLNMDGSEGEMAREVRTFAAKLAAATRLPVELADERLTSWAAEQDLRGRSPARRKKDRGRTDAMAAARILADWIAAHR